MVVTSVKPMVKPESIDDSGNIPGGNQGNIWVIPWLFPFWILVFVIYRVITRVTSG